MQEWIKKIAIALIITGLGAFAWVAAERPEAFDRLFPVAIAVGMMVLVPIVFIVAIAYTLEFDEILSELRELKKYFDEHHREKDNLRDFETSERASMVDYHIESASRLKSKSTTALMLVALVVIYLGALYGIHVAFNPDQGASASTEVRE